MNILYLAPYKTIYEYSGEFQQYCAECGLPIEEKDPVVIQPYYYGDPTDDDKRFVMIFHEGDCAENVAEDGAVETTQVGFKCLRCYTELYSNSRHDFVSCACGAHFIDGGFDYIRSGGLPYIPTESISRQVVRATLKHYREDEVGKVQHWTREECMTWNKNHWDEVGEAVTKRLEWWETVRGSEAGYGDGEIDI